MKDALDELIVNNPKLNLTTAKIRLHQRESEIKKLKRQHQKIKFKLERKVEGLEKGVEASASNITYWVDKCRRASSVIRMIDKKFTFFEDDLPQFQKGDVFIAKREWVQIKKDALVGEGVAHE